jgi:hypothetical protein
LSEVAAVSLEYLTAQYDREVDVDPRAAAETAYSLAFRYRDQDVDGETPLRPRKAVGAARDHAA